MKEIIDYGLNSCVDGQDSKNKITRKYSSFLPNPADPGAHSTLDLQVVAQR